MQCIEWSEDLETGYPELDRQHLKLVKLHNDLINSQAISLHSELVSDALVLLMIFSTEHFDYEEKLMVDIECPFAEQNKIEHRQLLEDTARYCVDVLSNHPDVVDEIVLRIHTWVSSHLPKEVAEIRKHQNTHH